MKKILTTAMLLIALSANSQNVSKKNDSTFVVSQSVNDTISLNKAKKMIQIYNAIIEQKKQEKEKAEAAIIQATADRNKWKAIRDAIILQGGKDKVREE